MKIFLACLATVLPLCAGQPGPLPPVSLYIQFTQGAPAAIQNAMRAEVESIMAPMGWNFRWLNLTSYPSGEVAAELAVIAFKGRCDVNGLLARDSNPGRLGWTHISDGIILPFADVDCSAVRSFIQKELYFTRPVDRAPAFGRALGRVLAHELYHIFANTRHHGSDGVGRESYSARDLLAADFQFEAHESEALLNSRAHAALAGAAGIADDLDPEHLEHRL